MVRAIRVSRLSRPRQSLWRRSHLTSETCSMEDRIQVTFFVPVRFCQTSCDVIVRTAVVATHPTYVCAFPIYISFRFHLKTSYCFSTKEEQASILKHFRIYNISRILVSKDRQIDFCRTTEKEGIKIYYVICIQ